MQKCICAITLYLHVSHICPLDLSNLKPHIRLLIFTWTLWDLEIHENGDNHERACSKCLAACFYQQKVPAVGHLTHEGLVKHNKIAKVHQSKDSMFRSKFLAHIHPYGEMSNSRELRPAVNERGPVRRKTKKIALNRVGFTGTSLELTRTHWNSLELSRTH